MAINPDLKQSMSRFVGTWRTEGVIFDEGENVDWAGYDIYEWFPGEQQMIHRVDVQIFGARKESIEVFTPREESGETFDQISFDGGGAVDKATGSFDSEGRYHLEAEGMRAVLTFDGPSSLSADWMRQDPDGTWVDWMQVSFRRIGEPHIEVRSKQDHA